MVEALHRLVRRMVSDTMMRFVYDQERDSLQLDEPELEAFKKNLGRGHDKINIQDSIPNFLRTPKMSVV